LRIFRDKKILIYHVFDKVKVFFLKKKIKAKFYFLRFKISVVLANCTQIKE